MLILPFESKFYHLYSSYPIANFYHIYIKALIIATNFEQFKQVHHTHTHIEITQNHHNSNSISSIKSYPNQNSIRLPCTLFPFCTLSPSLSFSLSLWYSQWAKTSLRVFWNRWKPKSFGKNVWWVLLSVIKKHLLFGTINRFHFFFLFLALACHINIY